MPQDLGVFAKRQLESVRDQVYEKDLEPLTGYEYFPQRTDAEEFAEYYVIRQYDRVGYSRWQNELAGGGEYPRADVVVDEDQFPLHSHVCAYGYTRDEMLRSQQHGLDLELKRASAARRAVRQKNDHVMFFGDESVGLFGAVNYPGTPRVYFSNVVGTNTSAATIIEEITALIDTPNEVTKNTSEVDVVGFPTDIYNHIRKRNANNGTDTTILQYLRDVVYDGNIDMVKMPELSEAGPNGEDIIFAFRDDTETWGHTLARPFNQGPSQQDHWCWEVPCESKTGGVSADFPLRNAIGIVPTS